MIALSCECDNFHVAENAFRVNVAKLYAYRSGSVDDAAILSLHAAMAQGRNKYAESEDFFHRSIQLLESSARDWENNIEELRNNPAMVTGAQGHYGESLAESQKAIASFDRANSGHLSFVISLNNAARALTGLGRKEEAGQMFE